MPAWFSCIGTCFALVFSFTLSWFVCFVYGFSVFQFSRASFDPFWLASISCNLRHCPSDHPFFAPCRTRIVPAHQPLRRSSSALSHTDLPGFPRWRGPMGSAVRASQTMSNPQSSRPCPDYLSQSKSWPYQTNQPQPYARPMLHPTMLQSHPFPPTPPHHISPSRTPTGSPAGSVPGSHSTPQSSTDARIYGFDLNEHWQPDKDYTTTRRSMDSPFHTPSGRRLSLRSWTLKDVILYHFLSLRCFTNKPTTIGSESWRQADMQSWIPVKATDPDSQHEITQLRQQVAQLRQRVGDTQSEADPPTSSTPAGPSVPVPPIQQSLQGANAPPAPPAFEPQCLLTMPGNTNSWLTAHLPGSLNQRTVTSRINKLNLPPAQKKHRPDQLGESRNVVVPTTRQRCRHHPEGGDYDGHSPQPSSEELWRRSTDPRPHVGHLDDQLTSSHSASEAQAQTPSTTPSVAPFDDSCAFFAHSVYYVRQPFCVLQLSHCPGAVNAPVHHSWSKSQLQTEGDFGRMCQSNHLWGSTLESHQLPPGFFPAQLCVLAVHTYQQFSTQILHWVSFPSCTRPRIQSHSEVPWASLFD